MDFFIAFNRMQIPRGGKYYCVQGKQQIVVGGM